MNAPWLDVDVVKRLPGFCLEAKFQASAPVVSLFGPSGSGKSLTLSAIAGLARPDLGRISLGGRTLLDREGHVDVPPQARRVGMVFQSCALFPHLSVEQNLRFGLPGARRRDPRVLEAAGFLGLERLLDSMPSTLSGGERRRVALGRALLPGPDALLLDEPFAALDAPERERIRAEILERLSARGIPCVLVTHDLEEAFLCGGEIVVVGGGKVLQSGPREEVIAHPRTELVASLMAVRNFLCGVVSGRDGDLVEVDLGPASVLVPATGLPKDARELILGIRADNVRIIQPGRTDPKPNRLEGVIVSDESTGLQHQLVIDAGGPAPGKPLRLRAAIPDFPYRRMGLAPGQRIAFYLPPRCLQVIR